MAFCPNCGTQVPDGITFCSSCGASMGSDAGKSYQQQYQQPPPQPQYQQPQYQQPQYQQPQQQQYQSPPPPPQQPGGFSSSFSPPPIGVADPRDVAENKTMAILAYLFFFVPLLVGAHKTSPFVRFHTNQGTVLFICGVIYGVAYPILSIILALIPIIGWIIIFLLGLAGIMFLVWLIMGIVNASQGQLKPLPFIGKFEIVK